MKRRILLAILAVLACSPLLPRAQAVSPASGPCEPNELNFTTPEGCDALNSLTTGAGNTALGFQSLFFNSTGNFNTGVGADPLLFNNADSNTAIGAAALLLNTTGTQNTAVGTDALVFNDSGDSNTATGYFALVNNTTGGSNTASGSEALTANTTGNNNTAIGNQALQSSQITTDNVVVGRMAGSGITTADNNIIIGHHSGVHSVFGQESNRSYIDNISGAPVSAKTAVAVFVDADGRLGTVLVPTPTPTPTPIPCSWSAGPDLPSAGAAFVGVFFPANGKFYVMGGSDANGVAFTNPFEYDPATNAWTTKSATYPDAFTNNMACSVLNDSGTDYIYCAGGSGPLGTTTGRVFRYDPNADSITPVVNFNWPPGDTGIVPGGFTVFNNNLYIVGGWAISNNVGFNQTWRFIPNPASWVQLALLPAALGYIPTTTIGSLIYTGGGQVDSVDETTNSFVYDPATNTWSSIAPIPRATSNTRAVNFCNQMYVLGGGIFVIPSSSIFGLSSEVDIYDPASNTWSVGIPFAILGGANFAADTDGTNNIWKAGGFDSGGAIIASMEIFNCAVSPCGPPSLTPTAPGKAKATVERRDLGGFSPKGIRPQAIPDATRQAMLNLKVQNLQATIPQQQRQIETLTAQVKEQTAQIQKVNAQLEKSKPPTKVIVNKP